jgi:predicted RecA/RadA family phage recombinase
LNGSAGAAGSSGSSGSSGVSLGGTTLNNDVDNYIATMTGIGNTLQGETDLRFDGYTLTQNNAQAPLPTVALGGIISNIDYRNFIQPTEYPAATTYTGETMTARAYGVNVTSVGLIRAGQLCFWNYDATIPFWGFDIADGSVTNVGNTFMLAIALEDITLGDSGVFLLKGFVSTPYINIAGGAREGSPLYIQRSSTPFGYVTDVASWTGTSGTDIWRCIGYLVSNKNNTTGSLSVIRFDPSQDYLV